MSVIKKEGERMKKTLSVITMLIGIFAIGSSMMYFLIAFLHLLDGFMNGDALWYFQANPSILRTAILCLLYSIFLMFVGVEILRRKEKGKKLAIISPFVYALFMILTEMYMPNIYNLIASMCYSVFVFLYFFNDKVKEQFKPSEITP